MWQRGTDSGGLAVLYVVCAFVGKEVRVVGGRAVTVSHLPLRR